MLSAVLPRGNDGRGGPIASPSRAGRSASSSPRRAVVLPSPPRFAVSPPRASPLLAKGWEGGSDGSNRSPPPLRNQPQPYDVAARADGNASSASMRPSASPHAFICSPLSPATAKEKEEQWGFSGGLLSAPFAPPPMVAGMRSAVGVHQQPPASAANSVASDRYVPPLPAYGSPDLLAASLSASVNGGGDISTRSAGPPHGSQHLSARVASSSSSSVYADVLSDASAALLAAEGAPSPYAHLYRRPPAPKPVPSAEETAVVRYSEGDAITKRPMHSSPQRSPARTSPLGIAAATVEPHHSSAATVWPHGDADISRLSSLHASLLSPLRSGGGEASSFIPKEESIGVVGRKRSPPKASSGAAPPTIASIRTSSPAHFAANATTNSSVAASYGGQQLAIGSARAHTDPFADLRTADGRRAEAEKAAAACRFGGTFDSAEDKYSIPRSYIGFSERLSAAGHHSSPAAPPTYMVREQQPSLLLSAKQSGHGHSYTSTGLLGQPQRGALGAPARAVDKAVAPNGAAAASVKSRAFEAYALRAAASPVSSPIAAGASAAVASSPRPADTKAHAIAAYYLSVGAKSEAASPVDAKEALLTSRYYSSSGYGHSYGRAERDLFGSPLGALATCTSATTSPRRRHQSAGDITGSKYMQHTPSHTARGARESASMSPVRSVRPPTAIALHY